MEEKELQSIDISPIISSTFAVSSSDDNQMTPNTKEGIHFAAGWSSPRRGRMILPWLLLSLLLIPSAFCGNITAAVFGAAVDGMPAAFGDFNNDDLTDMFVLRESGTSLEVLLAYETEPLLRPSPALRCRLAAPIRSVVPGNFDGDSNLDVLVTTLSEDKRSTLAYLFWGGRSFINCSTAPLLHMEHQPMALDYNGDAIVDLFGVDLAGKRGFWVFHDNRTEPLYIPMPEDGSREATPLRRPHSHAFLDWNDDLIPDIVLSTSTGYETWLGTEMDGFVYNETLTFPAGVKSVTDKDTEVAIGQSIFLDLELKGQLYHLVPLCFDEKCTNSTIYAHHQGKWHNLNPNLKDSDGKIWGFAPPDGRKYTDTITLRSGDFNMDGYPDLLATMALHGSSPRAFLLENVACGTAKSCDGLERTFVVAWGALSPSNNASVAAMFYDLYQDGIPDVILAGRDRVEAFRNTLDYDTNFVKVMVLTGTGRGGSLPGPKISYGTTTQEGNPRAAVSVQLPQSAHFPLGLPYTIFGLGRTPNFVDTLVVGVGGKRHEWTQIIPNSQMVVLLRPPGDATKWRAQLFVTPSKLILLSVVALTGTCGLITLIIVALYWKERREDRIEKLQDSHKFHFDAM